MPEHKIPTVVFYSELQHGVKPNGPSDAIQKTI